MIVKVGKVKIGNLRHAVLHRAEGDKKKKNEIMRHIKAEMKDIGFWKHKDKDVYEFILSQKLPANARDEAIQKEWEKQKQAFESVIYQRLKSEYDKVVVVPFRHQKQTIDGHRNVHTHFLVITIKNGKAVPLGKKKAFSLAQEVLKKYDPLMWQRYRMGLKKKSGPGQRVIYDTSRAPLWYCQKLKSRIMQGRSPGLLGNLIQIFHAIHKGTLKLDYELKHSHSEESDLPNAPHPPPQNLPPALTKYRKRKKKKSLTSII